MHNFSPDELQRYARHFSVEKIGLTGQEKLKAASVLLIGTGGIGSPAALYLTAAGVGRIGLIDTDTVDISNLQRQVLFQTDDCGKAKVSQAKAKLAKLNPNCQIDTYQEQLTADNAIKLITDYDLVIDGSDNYATRYIVNDASATQKIPLVSASIYQFSGQLLVFNFKNSGPCYRCLYATPPPQELIPNCAAAGVLGTTPGILGTLAANEALKFILNLTSAATNHLTVFDGLDVSTKRYSIVTSKDCPICTHGHNFTQLPRYQIQDCTMNNNVTEIDVQTLSQWRHANKPIILLDVRQPWEREICHIPNDQAIVLDELANAKIELAPDSHIVAYCRAGCRSKTAAVILAERGFNNVVSLAGGILAWGKEVDHDMPSY